MSIFFLWGHPNLVPIVLGLTGYLGLTQIFFLIVFLIIFFKFCSSTLDCLIIELYLFIQFAFTRVTLKSWLGHIGMLTWKDLSRGFFFLNLFYTVNFFCQFINLLSLNFLIVLFELVKFIKHNHFHNFFKKCLCNLNIFFYNNFFLK